MAECIFVPGHVPCSGRGVGLGRNFPSMSRGGGGVGAQHMYHTMIATG